MLSFSLLAGAFLCLSIEQRFACSRFSRTDVLSGMPLRGREEDDTSYRKRKSGRSMRRNEGSSQYRWAKSPPNDKRTSTCHPSAEGIEGSRASKDVFIA